MTDKIEIMARAQHDKDPSTFDALPELLKLAFLSNARAQTKALEANGFAIVPIEPTEAMLEAGAWDNGDNEDPHYATTFDIDAAWERMIQAAQGGVE